VNDLPIMLDVNRVQIPVGKAPELSLYLLDENVYPPEPAGVWVHGERRGDVVIRTKAPLSKLRVTLSTMVPNTVWLSFDGSSTTVHLKPGVSVDVLFSTSGGVYADRGWGYLLSVKPSAGMVPMNYDSNTADNRFLGVLLHLQGTEKR
jgi:hypothetical protein